MGTERCCAWQLTVERGIRRTSPNTALEPLPGRERMLDVGPDWELAVLLLVEFVLDVVERLLSGLLLSSP